MKKFDVPVYYRSPFISKIKDLRKLNDPRKKDFSPTILDFGPLQINLARHFGFCYGVENAIEISYKALAENPGKKIYLLSQMIHNQMVNLDLQERGIEFIMDTQGNMLISWDDLTSEDIVIIPAFGTTLEIEGKLMEIGLNIARYNTTCPFVEKVWKRSSSLGENGHTIVIHGKHNHEETRATFSHSYQHAPSIVIRDMAEAKELAQYVLGKVSSESFTTAFKDRYSDGFDPKEHLNKLGVVNQTTMLATETQEIADYFRSVMISKFGESSIKEHFADTRDTLCYATNDNQSATYGLLETPCDLAIVVGGYNSSNTSHIAELCAEKVPTYFIDSPERIESKQVIHHFDYASKSSMKSTGFLDFSNPVRIIVTSGASCPDSLVEEVIIKLVSFFPDSKDIEQIVSDLTKS